MLDGILLIDKPTNMTSFGVVARIRRVISDLNRERSLAQGQSLAQIPKRIKVGHAGTLDPFASGLLIVLVGKATKCANSLLKLDKTYEATICLGQRSTTGDPEGEITATPQVVPPTPEEVMRVCAGFTGVIKQRVPQFSAVKIKGRRAYELARKGIEIEMPTREVEIYELKVLDYRWPELKIRCKVSSGTYIRALGEDIGEDLGVGGYLTTLRRTEVGEYNIAQAYSLRDVMDCPEKVKLQTKTQRKPGKRLENSDKM